MKKFLMYTVVLVTMLFIGYTTYYFLRNNENMYLTLAEGESVYLNKDETIDLPLTWTKPYKTTKLYENVSISNTDVVSFDINTKKLVGISGGVAQVVVTPSNENFGPFRFDVYVGDGTLLYPFYVKSADDLLTIGKNETWNLNCSYMVTNNIELKGYDFTPIGNKTQPFNGAFNGNFKTISNLSVNSALDAGMFGATSSTAVVENIALLNPTISGSYENAGAIVGFNKGIVRLCNVTNFTLHNSKADSNNGGIVGYSQNTSSSNNFQSFGYIDMCEVQVNANTSGNFGGIVGKLEGSVVYNSKSPISSFEQQPNSLTFGSIAGVMNSAVDTTEYMFSVIKNSYAVVGNANVNAIIAGAVVGINEDAGTSFKNLIKNVYYNATFALQPVGQSNVSIDVSSVEFKSMTELTLKDTYKNWDFENVWVIDEGVSSAQLDYGYAEAQALNELLPGEEITNLEDLMAAFEILRNNPSNSNVYEITNSLVLDLQGAEWETIAPNVNVPLKSSIVCNNATLTIKNFKISNQNSSFFGYLSGVNTKMQGIIFEDVTVNSNSTNVAVIADALLDNATLQDCEIINANITAGNTTNKVAVVVAENRGKVLNVKVNSNVLNVNTLNVSSLNVDIGGLTAYNIGTIKDSTISMYNMSVDTDSLNNAFVNYGGICAVSVNGSIKNCYNYDCAFTISQINGIVNAGGVVGDAKSKSEIVGCFSEGLISLPYVNKNTYVAGVVAILDATSMVRESYYANQTLQAYHVAGIVQTNSGTVDQCYFKGDAKGVVVAGMVDVNNNSVTNCYVLGSLTGMTSDSKVSGLVSKLPVGSLVEHCFSSATFAGTGKLYAETESAFRATIEQVGEWFGRWEPTGKLTNCIVINYGDAYVQSSLMGLIKTGWINCTDEQAKGLKDDYAPFKKDAGFDQNVWSFDSQDGSGYPTLIYVVKNPNDTI